MNIQSKRILVVDSETRQALMALVESGDQALANRAKAVLYAAAHPECIDAEVSFHCDLYDYQVKKWRERYLDGGVPALHNIRKRKSGPQIYPLPELALHIDTAMTSGALPEDVSAPELAEYFHVPVWTIYDALLQNDIPQERRHLWPFATSDRMYRDEAHLLGLYLSADTQMAVLGTTKTKLSGSYGLGMLLTQNEALYQELSDTKRDLALSEVISQARTHCEACRTQLQPTAAHLLALVLSEWSYGRAPEIHVYYTAQEELVPIRDEGVTMHRHTQAEQVQAHLQPYLDDITPDCQLPLAWYLVANQKLEKKQERMEKKAR